MQIVLLVIYGLLQMLSVNDQEKATEEKPPHRPNIIWIVNEDMSPAHLGVYGGTGGHTPHLDALAGEGMLFTNAFSTAGVCAPSRAALITGAYQTSIGAMHMRTTNLTKNTKGEYVQGLVPYSAMLPAGTKTYAECLRAAGYYTTNNAKEDYQFSGPVTMWDESSRQAHWRKRKDKNQPFFSVFNFNITHESQVWERAKETLLVHPDSVTVPPVYPDDSISRHTIARFITNIMRFDQQVGELIAQLKEDGLYEETIIFYYADHGDGMPYFKRELYDRGLRVPLIIKAPFLPAGSKSDALVSFVDFAPTVLSLAGVSIPAAMQGQVFLGKQKAIPRKYIYAARDRMDTEYDRVRAVRDARYKYIRNYMPEKPNYQQINYRLQNPLMLHLLKLHELGMLNAVQERWFNTSKPEEELYDTQNDPWEFNNLAGDNTYAGKLAEMRNAHLQWIAQYGDMGQMNELDMLKKWWGGQDHPPTTATPQVSLQQGKVTIASSTADASIGYRSSTRDGWIVYTKPFAGRSGDSLYINAHRIGMLPAEIAMVLP